MRLLLLFWVCLWLWAIAIFSIVVVRKLTRCDVSMSGP